MNDSNFGKFISSLFEESEYRKQRRERNRIKFDIRDVHDRTCLLFLFAYLFLIATFSDTISDPIDKMAVIKGMLYAGLMCLMIAPFFLKHFFHFIEKQDSGISKSDLMAVFVFCSGVILMIALLINYFFILGINSRFDSSETVTRYTLVKLKEDYAYVVTDWATPGKTKKIKVSRQFSHLTGPGNVLRLQTKSGFLGIEYLCNPEYMKGIYREEFPPETTFPISEEEFQKIHIAKDQK